MNVMFYEIPKALALKPDDTDMDRPNSSISSDPKKRLVCRSDTEFPITCSI
jgi:hypothetical protein